MNKIEASTKKVVDEIIKDTDYELVDIEYVKEGPFKYLKVYLDKPGGITVNDTADVSRMLNKKLDEVDLIKEQYFLEVSSPGIERPFKNDADYINNIGNMVEAKFFKPIEGKKLICGILVEKKEDSIVVKENDEHIEINIKDISKINRMLEDF